ncbi:MFS transporter [Edaphobacter acidisoli]|uniref:MFS transporter n=1 Tax=Edaphobacter acidisoli TaxID=2040573 RepID=A0A916RHX8_9BACT|nr:MFS transporter [Edaphobacter acidisoli]GGA54882.1 MFS transporter [Edaphobacter acidisoli]
MQLTRQSSRSDHPSTVIFYGWWIVVVAFINLFFAVGMIYYGFPVFYPSLSTSLGFTRAQVTQGFLIGFIAAGIPFSLVTGAIIDRIGTRRVILSGVGLIGVPLILMGCMTRLWQYEILCVLEVMGYTLTGPIANQVLITQWFRVHRGRAMGYAYLGLGLGGVIAPISANILIHNFGWRHAIEIAGVISLFVLTPINLFVTRSAPADLGLFPDGNNYIEEAKSTDKSTGALASIRTRNFWLILIGATLVIGAINAIIQHFIFFLTDQGYSKAEASQLLSALLASSLGGRVLIGYIVDRFQKKNTMALFYLVIGGAIPILFLAHQPAAAWSFAIIFGFAVGADYMLIPLVTAECFGISSLGKLLAILIMGYSAGQWIAPWLAGRLFDKLHNYNYAWTIMAEAGIVGAAAIYAVTVPDSKLARSTGKEPLAR